MFSIYLIVGTLCGILSGLFGIGGGVVIVPALATIFLNDEIFPKNAIMHMAVGTSLATMIFTSLATAYAHHRRGAVKWQIFKQMVPGLIAGTLLGSIVAHFVPSSVLRIFFGIFLIVIGYKFLKTKDMKMINEEFKPKKHTLVIASSAIGGLSSILGVGGGTLLVPFLLSIRLDMRSAAGTSVACALVVATTATLCFMLSGPTTRHVPDSTGYIYWPALVGIAVASMLFAPVGAALSHRLPPKLLRRIFAILLFVMSIDMLFFS